MARVASAPCWWLGGLRTLRGKAMAAGARTVSTVARARLTTSKSAGGGDHIVPETVKLTPPTVLYKILLLVSKHGTGTEEPTAPALGNS